MLLGFAVLLASLVAFAKADVSQRLGNSEFILVEQSVNFAEARLGCLSLNATLAVPFSRVENDLVIELSANIGDVWIGTGSIFRFPSIL